jgi:hypothetical protein
VLRKRADGTLKGETMPAFNYSGKQILSPELFEKKRVAEEKDKEEKANPWRKNKTDGGHKLGYWGRYPETLSGELDKAVNKGGIRGRD